jgi:hypothetical protein
VHGHCLQALERFNMSAGLPIPPVDAAPDGNQIERQDPLVHEGAQRQEFTIRRGGAPSFERVPTFDESPDLIEEGALAAPAGQVMPDRNAKPACAVLRSCHHRIISSKLN